MDDADPVRRGQTRAGRQEDRQHLARPRLALAQPGAERAAVHELHGEEDVSLEGADVVDRHHVRVRELRERAGLARQAQPRLLGAAAEPGQPDHLERDGPVELGIEGLVDDAHAAAPLEADDDVAADHRAGGQLERTGQAERGRHGDGGRAAAVCPGQLGEQEAASRAAIQVPLDLLAGLIVEGSANVAQQRVLRGTVHGFTGPTSARCTPRDLEPCATDSRTGRDDRLRAWRPAPKI